MNSEQLVFECDGIRLRAKLDQPAGAEGKLPLVIILHGLTGNMDEVHIRAVAQAANEAGYAALRVDQYGHGTSEGAFEDHNMLLWMSGAMRIIDEVRRWDWVTDIILCGHSQGGLNTMMVGGMMADRLKALIPLSPATNIAYGVREGQLLGYRFDPENMPESITLMGGERLNSDYLRAARMLDVEYAIRCFTKPVCVIHGTDDLAVPYPYGVELANAYAQGRLVTIEGDDHCYNHHLTAVTAAVKEFLNEIR